MFIKAIRISERPKRIGLLRPQQVVKILLANLGFEKNLKDL